MAVDITNWHVGEDREFVFEILDAAGAPLDVAAWVAGGATLQWGLMLHESSTAYAFPPKTLANAGIEIVGTFHARRAMNTQRVVVRAARDDTKALAPRQYVHQLTRENPWLVVAQGSARLLPSFYP